MTISRHSLLSALAPAILPILLSGCVGLRSDPILRAGPGADFDSELLDRVDKLLGASAFAMSSVMQLRTGLASAPH